MCTLGSADLLASGSLAPARACCRAEALRPGFSVPKARCERAGFACWGLRSVLDLPKPLLSAATISTSLDLLTAASACSNEVYSPPVRVPLRRSNRLPLAIWRWTKGERRIW